MDIAAACDNVKGVSAEFLDHIDSKHPFYIQWGCILDKYFNSMPVGYTSYYFFKFDNETSSYRFKISLQATNFSWNGSFDAVCIIGRLIWGVKCG